MRLTRTMSALALLCIPTGMTACSGIAKSASPMPAIAQNSTSELNSNVRTNGTGFRLLHAFKGGTDGASPYASLTALNGALYGTTSQGGAATTACGNAGCGTIFSLSASGKKQVLYRLKGGADGMGPAAALVALKGVLYGTTQYGGDSKACASSGCGTVFAISTSGKERVLYAFKGGTDGAAPLAGLIALNGILYGTTSEGGATGNGIVFQVSASGKERVLYSFKGGADGAAPYASLVAAKGILYGTTRYGGGYNLNCSNGSCGTVFAVTTLGKERVLHGFAGPPNDGAQPEANVIVVNGVLYGTTSAGGTGSPPAPSGYGTIFRLTTSGKERVLYSFAPEPDAQVPAAGLVAINGTLYGTTAYGGSGGLGAVFASSTSGGERVLHSFDLTDGATPVAALAAFNGALYGTTSAGGASSWGTIFRL